VTKTEYARYIKSPGWQERRKEFLFFHDRCNRCEIPRWLVEIAFDQDLNVHHVSYGNLGNEPDDDLEALCRRCHEIEKFGRSELRKPKTARCGKCAATHWNPYSDICESCHSLLAMYGRKCTVCENIKFIETGWDTCHLCRELMSGNFKSFFELSRLPDKELGSMLVYLLTMLLAVHGKNKMDESLVSAQTSGVEWLKRIAREHQPGTLQ